MESRRFLDLFGPPIAFRREFVPLTGSITAALLLSQMVYWTGLYCGPTGEGNQGWFYLPSQDEVQQQTCLTRFELEGARKRLRDRGLIEESHKNLASFEGKKNGVICYRVNQDKILELLGLLETSKPTKSPTMLSLLKTSNPECGKPAIRNAENQQSGMLKTSNPSSVREKELKENYIPPTPRGGVNRTPHTTRRQRGASVGVWVDDGFRMPATFPDDPRAQRVHDALTADVLTAAKVSLADVTYFNELQRTMREEYLARRVN